MRYIGHLAKFGDIYNFLVEDVHTCFLLTDSHTMLHMWDGVPLVHADEVLPLDPPLPSSG